MEAQLLGAPALHQDGMYGSRRSRLQKIESKLSAHMDSEDRRVKELTEGILYDFLPAALNVMLPRCEDMLQELDSDRCRAVASAALAVSALMNAPPGFLEFLLCVPWRKLSQLYPKSDPIDKLVSNLQVTDEERRKLVNTRIEPALMGAVLDFLYKDKHTDSVPPMLQLTPVNPLQPDDKSAPIVSRETVAALLDGATPLHCAALRGNPAQVDHLLYCGADPTLKTAAGELPIELVPVCGDRIPASAAASTAAGSACCNAGESGASGSSGGGAGGVGVHGAGGAAQGGQQPQSQSQSQQQGQQREHQTHRTVCRCMGPHDQEVWECRSKLARSLIARRCFFSFGVGLFSWLKLVVFCLLCMLGQAGCYTSVSRPVVERHIETRRQQKIAAARARAHALVTRMRSEATAGHEHLAQAKRECMASPAFQRGPPDISQMCFTESSYSNKSPPPPPPQISQLNDINFHLQESGTSSSGEELPSEKAFKCFVRSVHALQSLDLHGDTVPQVFAELVGAGGAESRETHVLEDEQADLYSCWAESVLLKFRGCTCPGCAALAVQAVRMAHIQATRLFGKVDRVKQTHAERWRAVGQALARVVYVHICLLLETEAQSSPTRSLVWRAEQCLREWDRLERAGLTAGAGVLDPRHVAALQRWAKTADADLYLAEALHGQPLPPSKTLQEVVQASVTYTPDGLPILARPVNPDVVSALDQALTLASLPSPLLAHIVRSVLANAAAELASAARLRELVGAKGAAAAALGGGGGGGTTDAVAALTEALGAAEPFRTRLGPEFDAAAELRNKWIQRATAVEKLEAAVEEVRSYTVAHPLSFSLAAAAAAAAAAASVRQGGGGGRSGSGTAKEGNGIAAADQRAGASGPSASASATGAGTGHGAAGSGSSSGAGGNGSETTSTSAPDFLEWERRVKQLEGAMNEAKDANVSVTKAKRLHKEMAAVAAAADASRQLEAVMARRPSGQQQLKLALNKAEAAASALSGMVGGGTPVPGLVDVLGPLVAAARRRLDTERAAEALSKAASSFRTLADLGRLEAAIYNAKKIGAEELDPESYRTSLELRSQLQEAARVRGALEAALRALQSHCRAEDAEGLEKALQDTVRWEELMAADTARARKALEQWRTMTLSDAKLARLLKEGAAPGVLARAIQEAAAAGVKVQHAKRVLKLMQALEAALGGSAAGGAGGSGGAAAAVGGGGALAIAVVDASGGAAAERYTLIKSRLEAAEQGGVTQGPLVEAARRTLVRLAALTAREALEAALKPRSDWSVAQRIGALREALDRAEEILGDAGCSITGGSASGDAGGEGSRGAGGEGGGGQQHQHQQPAQSHGQQPKLANGSAAGKTSRGKRSSGGSSVSSSSGGGGGGNRGAAASGAGTAAGVGEAAAAGAAAAVGQEDVAGTPSGPASCSSSTTSISGTTAASSGNSDSTSSGSSSSSGGVGSEDEAVIAVREMVRKARQVLSDDQAELTRIERERQEAERAKKEAQERERQERLRLEQERQKRDKAEAAERERALAEKRERAKAERARQQQQQQHRSSKATTATAAAAASDVSSAASTSGSGGRAGGKGAANKATQAAAVAPPAAASNARAAAAAAAAASPPSSNAAAAPAAAQAAGKGGSTPAGTPHPRSPPSAASSQASAPSHLSAPTTAPAVAAATTPVQGVESGGSRATGLAPASMPPTVLTAPKSSVPEPAAPAAASMPAEAVAPASTCQSSAMAVAVRSAVVHTRGDSVDSLGEVVHNLNRDVINALDMDNDGPLPPPLLQQQQQQQFMLQNYGYSQVLGGPGAGSGGTAAHAGAIASIGGGGGASGGGSGRTAFGAVTATTDSALLDHTPSQRTSSVLSSVASADDVILQSAGGSGTMVGGVSGGAIMGFGGGGGGNGGFAGSGFMSGTASLSTISSGYIAATNTASADAEAAAAAARAVDGIGGGGGSIPGMLVASGGSGSGGGGASATAKPRFGFVDLGGASWGLDSPLLSGSATSAALFPSLQPSMADYGSLLGGAGAASACGGGGGLKPDGNCWAATGPNAAGGGGGGGGMMMFAGGPGGGGGHLGGMPGRSSGMASDDASAAALIGRHPHSMLQHASAASASASGGLGGAGLVGMHAHVGGPTSDANAISALAASMVNSPRTTVATASAGVHGLLHIRPLGAGGMPTGSGPPGLAGGGITGTGSGHGGRPSIPLPMHGSAQQQQQQQQLGGSGGMLARTGFWTPPSFQGQQQAEMGGGDGGSGGSGGGSGLGCSPPMHAGGLQALDWQTQAGDMAGGLQMLQLSQLAAGGGVAQRNAPGSNAAAAAVAANRVCRFYLQGFCRDGERCRFAHNTCLVGGTQLSPPAAGSGGAGPLLQLSSAGTAPQQHNQHSLLGQQSGIGAAASGGAFGAAGPASASIAHSSAVGSFAFGAPGAEAFAPMGGGLGRGGGSAPGGGGGGDMLSQQTDLLQGISGLGVGGGGGSGGLQLRQGAGLGAAAAAGGGSGLAVLPAGLALVDRSQLGSQTMTVGAAAPPTSLTVTLAGGNGGGGGLLGPQQFHHHQLQQQAHHQLQQVQLRDNATGATYSAVLTVPAAGPSPGGVQSGGATQQQPLLLSLPDDLTFSPPSNPVAHSPRSGSMPARK